MHRFVVAALVAASLAACSAPPPASASVETSTAPTIPSAGYGQVPPFSRLDYGPFAREDAIAIAMREWRLFGSPVDDDPPGTRVPDPLHKPERYPGLWERVGEYWWESQDSAQVFAYWTGKNDGNGNVFPPSQDGHYAWSAAFISYIFRIAGAKDRFPYAASHAEYINAARRMTDGEGNWVITARRADRYAPVAGDVICLGRGASRSLTYEDLPTGSFPGHCDFVVEAAPGQLTVIGGNVDDAVTMKHVPTTMGGLLQDPDTGQVVDTRYPWFVVLKVAYDQ